MALCRMKQLDKAATTESLMNLGQLGGKSFTNYSCKQNEQSL